MKLLSTIEGELNRLFIFQLRDGITVEAVHYRGDTLCVSTQAGCPVRCKFCASGSRGLLRNLSSKEIVAQVSLLKGIVPIKRVAMAGIGDPLLNWRNVREAFHQFKRTGLKVSFYTVGFPLRHLDELIDLPHNGVTVSVHSLDPEKRKLLMPFAGDLHDLIHFLKEKVKGLSRRKRRKIKLAFLVMKGLNDSRESLTKIADLSKELGLDVVLLHYNETGNFTGVSAAEYERLFLELRSMGVRVTLSNRFRKERIGGCGTLTVGKKLPEEVEHELADLPYN